MFGKDLSALSRENLPQLRRRIGVVFQDFRLIDHLTSFENVALPLRIVGAKTRDFKEDVEELLTWVGLGDRMHAKPAVLSGGEQQRIAIARAVVAKPDLLLADEPTGSIDPDIGQRLMRLFVELNKLGTSVVIATHNEAQLSKVSAPILRLDRGGLSLLPPIQVTV